MNLSDFLYSEHFKGNVNNFMIELKTIEQRHIDWFKNREKKEKGKLHDRLPHHYVLHWNLGKISFKFIDNCELPDEIQGECMEAFYRNFN